MESGSLDNKHMRKIQHLNYFIHYRAIKLLNAMSPPTEREVFDILNLKT